MTQWRKLFTQKCEIALLSDPISKGHFTSSSVEDVNGTPAGGALQNCSLSRSSFTKRRPKGACEMMAASDGGLF